MKNGIRGGLAGKILRVDLTSREVWTEGTERYAMRYIGGRGINSAIMISEIDPETKWSDPENLLLFGAGALVGTLAPGACRISIDTKSVFNNGKGSANAGGHFGAELKFAGFDNIVISGKAREPVYLWIHDGEAEIRAANSIWGNTVYETEEALKKELKDERIKVAAIGPAGERLVRGSAIICDGAKAAGGSGVGCVMGDKKLKAIAVRGKGTIGVANPKRFFNAIDVALQKVKESPHLEKLQNKALFGAYYTDVTSGAWDSIFVVRNGQDDYWEIEKREKLMNEETGVPKYVKKMLGCCSCPVGCMPFLEIDEGKYKGTRGEGFWVNTIMDYGPRFDITDPPALVKAWLLANQLGLDADFAAGVLSWAFECYEKGIIAEKDTDGLNLEWGNADALIQMMEKLAYRDGIGDFLAKGVVECSKELGKGSEQFAIHMKGQESVEPFRIPKGWGLGVSTSPVAGRHLRGTTAGGSKFGPKTADFSATEYKDQAKYVVWQGTVKEIEDMIGICVFVGTWSGAYALEPSDYAELTSAAMGIDLTEEEFMTIGKRGRNLEKAFNTLHTDFDRKDDYPPLRFMEEPVKSGPYKGFRCEKEGWDEMLNEFYSLHGWDQETSLQTERCLMELEMEDVARKLDRAGKLLKNQE